jgi:hypothetical protein
LLQEKANLDIQQLFFEWLKVKCKRDFDESSPPRRIKQYKKRVTYFFESLEVLLEKSDWVVGLAQAQLHNAVLEQVFDAVFAYVGLALLERLILIGLVAVLAVGARRLRRFVRR